MVFGIFVSREISIFHGLFNSFAQRVKRILNFLHIAAHYAKTILDRFYHIIFHRSPPLRAFSYNAFPAVSRLGYDDRVDLFELFAFTEVQHTEILEGIDAAFLEVRAIGLVV